MPDNAISTTPPVAEQGSRTLGTAEHLLKTRLASLYQGNSRLLSHQNRRTQGHREPCECEGQQIQEQAQIATGRARCQRGQGRSSRRGGRRCGGGEQSSRSRVES